MPITSLQKLTAGILFLIFLRCTVHCQSNSRSYDTNDWIPVSTPYQNGNQNFPQLHAVHGKQSKPSESVRQFQDLQQQQNLQQQSNIQLKDQILNSAHQIRLSPPPVEVQKSVGQGLPFIQQHTPFLSQVEYEEPKQQASQSINQESIISQNLNPPPQPQQAPQNQEREVQLLYVPLETLRQREQRQQIFQDHTAAQSQVRFVDQQSLTPQAHKQVQLQNIEQDFIQQALQAHKLQQEFQQHPQQSYQPQQDAVQTFQHQELPTAQRLYQQPIQNSAQQLIPQQQTQQSTQQLYQQQPSQPTPQTYQQQQQNEQLQLRTTLHQALILEATTRVPTTPAPAKKRKPHQPPLAVYMEADGHNEISVSDVLSILKDAKTITVQDYVSEDSPKVFVGPSNLQSPEGYVKFTLPYLNSLDKHKKEGIDKLPFFVAPLNYKTPAGYSKIPFPSPHVGSVVINRGKEELREKPKSSQQNLLTNQPLNDKNSQLLYNEASTIASHNKNRQAYQPSYHSSTISPSSTVDSEIPYGPLPIKHEQAYSTHRPTARPAVSSTTPRTYSEPQHVSISPNLYSNNQFSKGHRFTTASPSSTESFSSSTQHSVTTNRAPSRTSHIHQRPQVSLSTPDDVYFDTTRSKSPNRYLPEIRQPQVSVTTPKYSEASSPSSDQEFINQHRFGDNYKNAQRNQESYVQNNPPKVGFEAHITRANFSINNQQNDQEFRPSYQSSALPNQYFETKTERTRAKVEDKPRVVTESSFVHNTSPQSSNQYFDNQQYHAPSRRPVQHQIPHQVQEEIQEQVQQHAQQQVQQHVQQQVQHQVPQQVQVHQVQQEVPQQVHHHQVQHQVQEETRQKEEEPRVQYQQHVTAQPSAQPNVYQQLPEHQDVNHRFVFNQQANKQYEQYEQPTFVSTERQNLQEYVTPQNQPLEYVNRNTQQHYKLPADLPISPHLPSLVNSLEDQAIRPLLAPLLLPSAEEAEPAYNEYTTQRVITTTLAPATTTHYVAPSSTPEPIVETTTAYKRNRGRPRGTRPTVSPSSRTRTSSSSYRGRRPYQEVTKQEPLESTTRAAFSRNRFSGQRERERERQPYVSTTEQSREVNNNYQKRFRTRGRPIKLEEEFATFTDAAQRASSTESIIEIHPSTQFAIQSLQENVHVTPGSLESSTEDNERKTYFNSLQNDQPLTYLLNGQHIINQNIQSHEDIEPQIYVVKEEVPISQEIKEPTRTVQEPQPSPRPVVQEIVQPTREIVEPVKIPKETSRVQPSIDQSQYLVETTKPRTRSRSRGGTRSRVHPRPTTTTPTTTTHAEIKEEEESKEFYGFFRQPTFKPLKMEYKPSSELRSTGGPIQQSTFAPQYDNQNTFYVNDARSSTPSVYQITNEDVSYNEHDNQYLNARVSSAPDNSYEDIKPVTIRTTPARRRYTTPVQQNVVDITTSAPEKYYSARPNKRPETQTQRVTRIRGRIRRPTTPLPSSERETSSEENYSARPQSAQREQSPLRTRSRGKSHFKVRDEDKTTDEDISENYPPSFLRSRDPTPRPSFKLTIEPEESFEEQEGAYSSHPKPKEVINGQESQRYEKTVEGPNQIKSEKLVVEKEKKVENSEVTTTVATEITSPVSAKLVDVSLESVSNEASEDKTEEAITETSSEADVTLKVDEEITTLPTTTTTQETTESVEKVTKKKGRRGHWKLVGQRPIDMFQSAESQNIGTVFANDLYEDGKGYKIEKVNKEKVAQMLSDQSYGENMEDLQNDKDDQSSLYDLITFTTESAITTLNDEVKTDEINTSAPEVEAVEVTEVQEGLKEEESDEQTDLQTDKPAVTDDETEVKKETEQVMSFLDQFMSNLENYSGTTEKQPSETTETESDFWKSKIIGTSTTTEISHETEICYKGRCIKSLM